MIKYDVCVVGQGYIGLPTALLFAEAGKNVLGYDVSQNVIDKINGCETGKSEPGLNELLTKSIKNGSLTAQTKPNYAEVYIISVPTPFMEGRLPDMTYVKSAVEAILPFVKKGCSIVLESTSPVGSTEKYVCEPIKKAGFIPGEDIFVAYSPERVLPGNILYELVNNNRILGGISEESCNRIKGYYKLFVKGDIEITDSRTAEMCKLLENAYRDVNIAFANEMSKMCEQSHINAWEVQKLCNKHPRVNILQPGPGVGGHCIAVDPWFLVSQFPDNTELISKSREVNDAMPKFTTEKIKKVLPPNGKKIAVLGITYKPNVDDTRESPVLKIIELLKEEGYDVSVHDPLVQEGKFANVSLEESVDSADLLILGVNHTKFEKIDFKSIYDLMNNKVILDTRNCLDKKILEDIGFAYNLLGWGR